MAKLRLVLLLVLSVPVSGGVVFAEPDPCRFCPWQQLFAEHFNATINDCAYLHSINRQNAESWAGGLCGGPICSGTFYATLSCTTKLSGTTVTGRLDYRCDCTLASNGPDGAPGDDLQLAAASVPRQCAVRAAEPRRLAE